MHKQRITRTFHGYDEKKVGEPAASKKKRKNDGKSTSTKRSVYLSEQEKGLRKLAPKVDRLHMNTIKAGPSGRKTFSRKKGGEKEIRNPRAAQSEKQRGPPK